MSTNAKFVDLPPQNFPFNIKIIDDELGLLWEETIEGPCALAVPGFGPERAAHRRVEVTHPDGSISISKGDEDA